MCRTSVKRVDADEVVWEAEALRPPPHGKPDVPRGVGIVNAGIREDEVAARLPDFGSVPRRVCVGLLEEGTPEAKEISADWISPLEARQERKALLGHCRI